MFESGGVENNSHIRLSAKRQSTHESHVRPLSRKNLAGFKMFLWEQVGMKFRAQRCLTHVFLSLQAFWLPQIDE